MQKERFNFIVDEETRKEFHKIMDLLKVDNKNQTFIVMVSTYMRKHFESELYRNIKKDIHAYEVLWEQMGCGNTDQEIVRR